MNHHANEPTAENVALDDVLAECERALELGQESSAAQIASRFPQYGDQLQEFLGCRRTVESLADPLRSAFCIEDHPPCLSDYEEIEEIARGGMGIVYKGRHKSTKRIDAIKVIRPDRLAAGSFERGQQMLQRFEQESRLAARVANEHVVTVYHIGEVEGRPYYSMRYVDGPSLNDLLTESPLPADQAARYIEQVARAVDEVHRHGVLHGDIKPQNILIDSKTDCPLITDFGLAELNEHDDNDSHPEVGGTPSYMPPELARAALLHESDEVGAAVTIASDVYSIGATLYALLTGSPPARGENLREQLEAVAAHQLPSPRTLNPTVPPALDRICLTCLADDPLERYRTAADLADDLTGWLNRPNWARFFPRIGGLLYLFAPVVFAANLLVFLFLNWNLPEAWVWTAMFGGYIPLFAVLTVGAVPTSVQGQPASRELWSVWFGHFLASLCCFIAYRLMLDLDRAIDVAYPSYAALAALAFFTKGANFWGGYRLIGAIWLASTVLMALLPTWSPLIFGGLAALTSCAIGFHDRHLNHA